MKASKFIAIIILGRPGSGKDTQAELLAEKFGLVHIISSRLLGKVLRSRVQKIKFEGKVYNLEKERRHIHSGALVNFNFVAGVVNDAIRKVARAGKGVIMSASPRSKTELKVELPLLKKLYGDKNIFFIYVWISPKEVYTRNLKRQRKDLPELDTRKVIKRRLEAFNRYTWPVIKLLKKQKRIIDINGEQPIMKIHKDILWQLQSKLKKK